MLYAFDLDGTLIRSFMREGPGGDRPEYDLVEPMPGRRRRLAELRAAGNTVALVTNQAGVAFGYQTEEQVWTKLRVAKVMLDLPLETVAMVCFAHPKRSGPSACADIQTTGSRPCWDPGRRKPSGVMLRDLMALYGLGPAEVVFVGDMDSDAAAAADAGCTFVVAWDFFGEWGYGS